MKLDIWCYKFELGSTRKEKHEHLKITHCLAIIFAEAKMVVHLSGLYNKLRKLNTTLSLSCVFKIATSCQMDGGSKLR